MTECSVLALSCRGCLARVSTEVVCASTDGNETGERQKDVRTAEMEGCWDDCSVTALVSLYI